MRRLNDLGKGLAVSVTAISAAIAVIAVGTPEVVWVFLAPCAVAFWAWSLD